MARAKDNKSKDARASRLRKTTRDTSENAACPPERLRVRKAYKMLVGGQFVRSESGRYIQVADPMSARRDEENVPWASRKDVRDAVVVARGAWEGWSGRTPYNRGQILYRLAEMLEARQGRARARARARRPRSVPRGERDGGRDRSRGRRTQAGRTSTRACFRA